MLEIGKRYSVDLIKSSYPDKWVILVNPEMSKDKQRTVAGILYKVCDYGDIDNEYDKCVNAGLDCTCFRTTFNLPDVGILM